MAARMLWLVLLLGGANLAVLAQPGANPAVAAAPISVAHATAEEVASMDRSGAPSFSIYSTPPTFDLVTGSAQAHPGKIWLRWTDEGLLVWGEVEAAEEGFRWPEQKSEMLSSDHVEVWLATTANVEMPAIGWGNQFGETELAGPDDCSKENEPQSGSGSSEAATKACVRWYGGQQQYRQLVRRLFVRQWIAAGEGGIFGGTFAKRNSFEDFAATAWAGLNANFFPVNLPVALQPKSEDGFIALFDDRVRKALVKDEQTNLRTGYKFHLIIPFSAFPPAQQLQLRDLYLDIDVFSAAPEGRKMGAMSSTAPAHQWGRPETFNHVVLATSAAFSVSPCESKLEQTDMYGGVHPAWFLPIELGTDLSSTFALINPANGYLYTPGGVSPEAQVKRYFWKQPGDGSTVCGPELRWRKGNAVKHSTYAVDEKTMVARSLPDGWTLVRTGPTMSTHSRFGSGQCGSCPVADFDVYSVSPLGDITPALQINQDLSGEGGSPWGADLIISDDWKRVTWFRATEGWSSVMYCLQGHAYSQCGSQEHANPPVPANFPQMRGEP